jgi:thioredoxin 1
LNQQNTSHRQHTETASNETLAEISPKRKASAVNMAVNHISSPAEFQSLLDKTMYVVTDFYADWCGPCKAIAPMYEQFAKASTVPGYLAFAKVNVDNVQQVAVQYGVSAMPTFMFFKNGKQVAVNGQSLIRGADVNSLKAATEKLDKLARAKQAAGVKVGE